MASIIKLMKELGYPTNDNGVCEGIALMAERARRCGEYNTTFKNRMDYLEGLSEGVIQQLLKNAKVQAKSGLPLTEKEEILLTVEAYFSQVWVYHAPRRLQAFLGLKGAYLNQGNTKIIENIIYDGNSNDNALAPLNSPVCYFLSIKGTLDLLQLFLDTVQKSNISHGLVISTPNHTVHLFCKNNIWYLTNHSSLTEYSSIDALLMPLVQTFIINNTNAALHLHFRVFTSEKSDNKELLQALTQISYDSIITISQGNKVNCTDYNNNTPLYVACQYGDTNVVMELLKNPNIDVNQVTNMGNTPLYIACQNNHVDAVRELLQYSKVDMNRATNMGVTPLYIACQNGHIDVVMELLKNPNIDVNHATNADITPLYIACQNGHINVVISLLQHNNIDVNMSTNTNAAPLFIACQYGHVDIVIELLQHPNINVKQATNTITPLYVACRNGYVDVVIVLLQHNNIDVNQATNNGGTPLCIACQNGHIDIVKKLLEYGAGINKSIAVFNSFLINIANGKGIDKANITDLIDGKSLTNFTPLHAAAVFGHTEILKLLLAKGTDIRLEAAPGVDALALAKAMNNIDAINLLTQNNHIINHDIKKKNQSINQGARLFKEKINVLDQAARRELVDNLRKSKKINFNQRVYRREI